MVSVLLVSMFCLCLYTVSILPEINMQCSKGLEWPQIYNSSIYKNKCFFYSTYWVLNNNLPFYTKNNRIREKSEWNMKTYGRFITLINTFRKVRLIFNISLRSHFSWKSLFHFNTDPIIYSLITDQFKHPNFVFMCCTSEFSKHRTYSVEMGLWWDMTTHATGGTTCRIYIFSYSSSLTTLWHVVNFIITDIGNSNSYKLPYQLHFKPSISKTCLFLFFENIYQYCF